MERRPASSGRQSRDPTLHLEGRRRENKHGARNEAGNQQSLTKGGEFGTQLRSPVCPSIAKLQASAVGWNVGWGEEGNTAAPPHRSPLGRLFVCTVRLCPAPAVVPMFTTEDSRAGITSIWNISNIKGRPFSVPRMRLQQQRRNEITGSLGLKYG